MKGFHKKKEDVWVEDRIPVSQMMESLQLNSQLIRLKTAHTDKKPYICPNYRKRFNWTDNRPWDKKILKPGLISSTHHWPLTSFLLCLLQTSSRFSPPIVLSELWLPSLFSVRNKEWGWGRRELPPLHPLAPVAAQAEQGLCFLCFSCNEIKWENYSLLPPSSKLPVRERIFFVTITSQVTSLLQGYYKSANPLPLTRMRPCQSPSAAKEIIKGH